ncbi:PrsW family glutamic-type intramembrane protease [Sporolactobacillus putidus]|uniref:Membrane protein n=1 Tax=Sporolactobacillus putidus TaxID=492735 RepID=A0A917S8T3_9BACL|nr:PrsW family glutamic-type intramembrane protease [Sporolactobacillus putidus]GGL61756.1 membrane protein [Sporolactobacillus putidus]
MDSLWYYYDGQETQGPFSEDEMTFLANKGQINSNTLVTTQGMTTWLRMRETSLQSSERNVRRASRRSRSLISRATEPVNELIGERGPVDLKLRDLFSQVFRRHTKAESERIFIAGTSFTTPNEADISSVWPKPWLFSRVFLTFLVTYAMLWICLNDFGNPYALPGLMLIGSFAVPFSLVFFFFETNAPRNISIFDIVRMFFLGGVASIIVTLVLYTIFPVYRISITSAFVIGMVEELGKLLIVIGFVSQLNVKYILNGLLIGAVIGAGFASFESAGYAFRAFQTMRNETFLNVIVMRAWTSIGTHAIWTAIAGAALVLVKQNKPVTIGLLFKARFLKLMIIPIFLHAFWDMPLPLIGDSIIKVMVLIMISWLFILVMINSGLKQVTRHSVIKASVP